MLVDTNNVLFDMNNVLFDGVNGADRICTEVFNDNFNVCIDITFREFEDNWKTFSALTILEGQIRLRPRTKGNIRAFVQ